MKATPIYNTEVLSVKAPRLSDMKNRACTLEELQAALVQLAEIVNTNAESRPEPHPMDKPYGL